MIKGLHHNVYRCRDSEETRRFYEDFLGLRLSAAMEVGSRGLHTFFALGDGSFLAFFEMPSMPFEFKSQDGFDLHIALEVDADELEPWLEKARKAGVPAKGISDYELARSIYFHDPDGYVIELTARMPAHDRMMDPAINGARRNLQRWQAGKKAPVSARPGVEPLASPA